MKKFEQFIFYFFIVSIPVSLRYIFGYQPFGFAEWKAISIYGTDILFVVLCVYWIAFGQRFKLGVGDWLLVALIGAAGMSSLHALDLKVSIYQTLKLTEFVIFFWYVKYYASRVFEKEKIYFALVVGAVFQAVVAIVQFMIQHSLGLKYFGESVLSPNMSGIAAFISNGVKIIRAYGTTPHPNVLAAYLIASIAAYWLVYPLFKKSWLWHFVYAILLWGLLVTFSRTIIGIGVLFFTVWAFKEFKKYRVLVILSLIIGAIFLATYWPYVVNRVTISSADEAISLRVLYNHEALAHGVSWFGIGIGDFVPWLMRQPLPVKSIGLPAEQYQPVHNIYLLIYAEMGLAGLGVFLAWLIAAAVNFFKQVYISREQYTYAGLFGVLLLAGLFDHFLWTIQSGQLLFWLTAGLLSQRNV